MDKFMRMSPMGLGLGVGVLSALSVVSMGLFLYLILPPGPYTASMGGYQIQYNVSILGILTGTVIAFVHAFVSGWVVAWFYNLFIPKDN